MKNEPVKERLCCYRFFEELGKTKIEKWGGGRDENWEVGWEDKVKDWKGVSQIAWKIVLDCLETVILVGNELGLFIIYLNYL